MIATLHMAQVNVGYCAPLLVSLSKDALVKEIAKTCRETWERHDWGMDAEGHNDNPTPEQPEDDAEAVKLYFHGEFDTPDGPWVRWQEYDLCLAPPYGEVVDLTVDKSRFTVERTAPKQTECRITGGGAVLDGPMIDGGGMASDSVEGFVLALTAAGFPVHLPQFKGVLQDYCCHLVERETNDTDEINEFRIAKYGWFVDLDPVTEQWAITQAERKVGRGRDNFRRIDVSTDRYETRVEAVAAAVQLIEGRENG